MKTSRKIVIGSALLCLLLGIYGVVIEPRMLKVARYDVQTEKWGGHEEVTIALIGDSHVVWPWMTTRQLRKIVARANELKPDVILLLGDYDGDFEPGKQYWPAAGVAPFKALSAPCGVYAVLGNHDLHGRGDWAKAMMDTGIPVLQNQARPVECKEARFWIAGLAELWRQNPNIPATMAQVVNDDPVIMMMHNPDSFVHVPQSVALSVAGHTHGGQVRLPFIGAVAAVIPSQYGKRFIYGHIQEAGKDMVVTSGLGMTGLPVRFLAPPEIALVTLSGG